MVKHHFGGGVYAKEVRLPAGSVVCQHKHVFDHLSLLAAGTVVVEANGEECLLVGPACLTIEKDTYHVVRAITDAVWYCIHATDCVDESAVDKTLIAPESDIDEMMALGMTA